MDIFAKVFVSCSIVAKSWSCSVKNRISDAVVGGDLVRGRDIGALAKERHQNISAPRLLCISNIFMIGRSRIQTHTGRASF